MQCFAVYFFVLVCVVRVSSFVLAHKAGNYGEQTKNDDNFAIQPRDGSFTIEPRDGSFIIQPRENFTIEPRDGSFIIQPRENFTIEPRNDNFTIESRNGNFTIEPRDGSFIIQPRRNCTVEPRNGNFTIEPRDGNFTIEPRDGNFSIQPRDDNFTIEPRDSNFTIEPRNGNFTTEPRNGSFIIQPRGNCTVEPRDGNFTIEPRDGNFTIEPRDGNFTIQSTDGNFTIEPRNDNFTIEPRDSTFIIQPRDNLKIQSTDDNFTIEPRANCTVEPRDGNFAIEPKDGNFTVEPRDGNFTIQPRNGNFTIQPRGVNFIIKQRDGSFTIQPRTRNFIIQPKGCLCGRKSLSRIVGGTQVTMNEYPWTVALCQGLPCSYRSQFCGATLINALYCITAAHCVEGFTASQLSVSLGDHNLASKTETDSVERKVVRIINHPGYNSVTQRNDIAIIKLSAPVPLSSKIMPACLPSPNVVYARKYAIATGWGTTSSEGPSPMVQREVSVQVMSNAACSERYPGAISAGMICAGSKNKDSCQGDSGGPLVLNVGGKFELIGVTSWGSGCGEALHPGVYTRVVFYSQFISENTRDAETCAK